MPLYKSMCYGPSAGPSTGPSTATGTPPLALEGIVTRDLISLTVTSSRHQTRYASPPRAEGGGDHYAWPLLAKRGVIRLLANLVSRYIVPWALLLFVLHTYI
jgi:hypothetical protein